ncbi:cytochrome P450 1A1-like [Saccostrea cucullata]|uniref:cytochrome P450 1A1-like n=1 Tax=Saccostrea cuccullata TaxID=36930 RepID=UPI002ED1894C
MEYAAEDRLINTILVILTVSLVVYASIQFRKRTQSKAIPGPRGLPWIGSAFHLGLSSLHVKLSEMRKEYGDLFQITLFGKQIIVVSSSSLCRELGQTEPYATWTASRPHTFVSRVVLRNRTGVIFTPDYDSEYKKRRKIAYAVLRAYGQGLQRLENRIKEQLDYMICDIKKLSGKAIDPVSLVDDFIIGNVELLLIGKRCEKDSEMHQLLTTFDHSANVAADQRHNAIYSMFPFLINFRSEFSTECRKVMNILQKLLSVLERNLPNDNTCSDAMYPVLKKAITEGEIDESSAASLMGDMMAAGYLTTRGTLLSMIRILQCRRDVLQRMRDEIQTLMGSNGGTPTLNDRPKFHYVEAFILETLRYISHVPITVRRNSERLTIRGYDIPKDTTMIINLWDINHTEEDTPRSFDFNPDRFLGPDQCLLAANTPVRKRFAAFGHGKRSCVGENFARSRIFLFIVTLVSKFSITDPYESNPQLFHPLDMSPGIALQPPNFKCIFHPQDKPYE